MIRLNLQRVAKKRGIEKVYTLLKKHGFDSDTASMLNQGKVDYIKFDKLEKLCNIFLCEPYDILEWVPDKDAKVNIDTHPLRVMLPKPDNVEIKRILRQLPLDQLDELLQEAKRKAEGK